MAKSVPALIEPRVLEWARTTAGYSVESAAKKIGVKPEKLAACEAGEDRLTFSQLETAANVYKRPLAVFFLREPPVEQPPVNDFRLDPDVRASGQGPAIRITLRKARRLRDEALALLADLGRSPEQFPVRVQLNQNTEIVADELRRALRVSTTATGLKSNAHAAFKARKAAAEELGVLVFEVSRVDCAEMRGAALSYDTFPVVVINGGEAPGGKSFTLLHELTHIALRQSSVCDLAPVPEAGPRENLERYCNAVAAACLMPSSEVARVVPKTGPHDWTFDELAQMSKHFQVSREAFLVRLVTLGYATRDYYHAMRNAFRREHAEYRSSLKKEDDEKNGPSPAVMAFRNLGKPFVQLVLGAYDGDRIGLSTVSDYLGVKVRHIERIRELASKAAPVT